MSKRIRGEAPYAIQGAPSGKPDSRGDRVAAEHIAADDLDEIANPADSSYIPRPEWYFLFYYQLLKYVHGPLEPLATWVLPAVFFLGLLLWPFIDAIGGPRVAKRLGWKSWPVPRRSAGRSGCWSGRSP